MLLTGPPEAAYSHGTSTSVDSGMRILIWSAPLHLLIVLQAIALCAISTPAQGEPIRLPDPLGENAQQDSWRESTSEEVGDPALAAILARLEDLEAAEAERKFAEQEEASKPAPRKGSAPQVPSVNWTGQLQADNYWFNQDAASKAAFGDIENGEAFRRARIGMFGDYGPTVYRIEVDFALSGRPSFLDVFGGINDLPLVGRARVGHFFEPFSMERLTANRFTTFMERSLMDQAFVPARNMGVMVNNTAFEEHSAWGLGIFRADSDVFGDDVGDNFDSAVTSRITFLPYYSESNNCCSYLHLGAAHSFRGSNNGVVRFRAQPEARIGSVTNNVPFFVDTGNFLADSYQLWGSEFALVNNSLAWQGEFTFTTVDDAGGQNPQFYGWYSEISYFLTGEHRPYLKEFGTFGRVIPLRDFVGYAGESKSQTTCTGPGAWQIAARMSQLDLDDANIAGGRLTDLTVGLNWYLNPFMRVTTNYVHAFSDITGGSDPQTDIFGMRFGYDF